MTAFVGLPARCADLLQDQRGEFFRRVLAAGDLDAQHLPPVGRLALDDLVRDELQFLLQVGERAAHEPLDAEDGVLGVGQGPVARRGADEHGAVVVEADAARHERDAARIADDDRPAVLDVRREAERGAEIDADDGGGGHGVGTRGGSVGATGIEPVTIRV